MNLTLLFKKEGVQKAQSTQSNVIKETEDDQVQGRGELEKDVLLNKFYWKQMLADHIFGIFQEILETEHSQDMRQLDSEGTNATLCAPWHSFRPEIDLGLTVALLTPSDKWQTFQVQSGLTWPMANKRPHAAQILDVFQVIDTADRLSSFVCLDYWHSDRIYSGKQWSLAPAVVSLFFFFFFLT